MPFLIDIFGHRFDVIQVAVDERYGQARMEVDVYLPTHGSPLDLLDGRLYYNLPTWVLYPDGRRAYFHAHIHSVCDRPFQGASTIVLIPASNLYWKNAHGEDTRKHYRECSGTLVH